MPPQVSCPQKGPFSGLEKVKSPIRPGCGVPGPGKYLVGVPRYGSLPESHPLGGLRPHRGPSSVQVSRPKPTTCRTGDKNPGGIGAPGLSRVEAPGCKTPKSSPPRDAQKGPSSGLRKGKGHTGAGWCLKRSTVPFPCLFLGNPQQSSPWVGAQSPTGKGLSGSPPSPDHQRPVLTGGVTTPKAASRAGLTI